MKTHRNPESASRRIKGVILDVDGTLVDSNDAHAKAWLDVLRKQGFEITYGKVRRLIGMGGDHFLPAAVGIEKDSPQGKQIAKIRSEHFKQEYLRTLKPFSGVPELLARFEADGIHMVAGSSSEPNELETLLKIAGATEYLENQTSAEDVTHTKPDPDIVHVALEKLDLEPDETVLIGDTPYDIEAASQAGVRAVAFRCGGWDDAALTGAIAIYDDPADLLAHYDQSPFMQRLHHASHD